MNRILLLFISALFLNSLSAQVPEDALRLSWTVPSGTARIQAVGGAMGSLGGDITATFVNPAGLGFYRTGDFAFTPMYNFGNTRATYLDRRETSTVNKFAVGTTGFVWGGSDRRNRSTAISLAINQTADFRSNLLYRGQNNRSSFSQSFLDEIANGNVRDGNVAASAFPFGTSLAFNTYWIDTIGGSTNGNFRFQTRAPVGSGLLQQNTVTTRGGITEFALGIGSSVSDKLMVGGTIGIPVMRFERDAEFVEADATENNFNRFDFAQYKQGLTSVGVGFNLKGGLIYRPQEFWRLGFAFHSPSVLSITDRNTAEITTNTENYAGTLTQKSDDVTGTAAEFKYTQITPLRLIASASYVLREIADVTRQRGFLTLDVEYVPHGMSRFLVVDDNGFSDPETVDYLKSLNRAVSRAYKGAFNVRAGGELKFTTVMVRAGVAYSGNPYRDLNNENGNRLHLSGGLGYRNKGFFIDATYVHALTRDVNIPYRLQGGAPFFNADLRSTTGRALLTVGVKI